MKTLMLAVGVSNYAHHRIRDLRLCVSDATQMVEAFENLTNHDFQSQLLLDEQATKANIRAGIAWLAQAAESDDKVIFYFCGHGARYQDLSGDDELDNYDEFLCPHDTGLGRLKTFIRDDELHQWLMPISQKTDKVVLIFDCCHSGSAHMAPAEAVAREIPPDLVRDLLGDYQPEARETIGFADEVVPGQLVLASCQDYQSSYEIYSWKNGLFTTYLLEGLADPQLQSFQELFDYAYEGVEEIADLRNLPQTPKMLDGLAEDLALR